MDLQERLNIFRTLDENKKSDHWHELLSIGQDFILLNDSRKELATKIADTILKQRIIMGSSKNFESAFEIDTELAWISIQIARIAYGKSKPLVEFLKSGLYYADVLPIKFNKEQLEQEIREIEQKNNQP